jgi:hypothetical protein
VPVIWHCFLQQALLQRLEARVMKNISRKILLLAASSLVLLGCDNMQSVKLSLGKKKGLSIFGGGPQEYKLTALGQSRLGIFAMINGAPVAVGQMLDKETMVHSITDQYVEIRVGENAKRLYL